MTLQEASEFLEKEGVASARTFLRSARERAKVSQLELSRLSGVPQPNLNRIESGAQEGFTARTFLRLYNAIEKRLIANHRDARRAEKLMQLSQKHGPLPQRELVALFKREEKAEYDRVYNESLAKYAIEFGFTGLTNIWHYAKLRALAEGRAPEQFPSLPELAERGRAQETERKRQLAALENARSVDDPIVREVIQLFRDEIESLEKANELLSRELSKTSANSDD